MILPKKRDPRFITVRRGGTLQDADHHLLAIWAADCAQHVLHLFEEMKPNDDRPHRAIELARAWARGEITMTQARTAAGHAMAAARVMSGAAREAAYAAGQAAAVAHVAAHELGAAAYAIRPHAQRPMKVSVTRQVAWNVNGNVHNFQATSGISCLTTRSCATKSAGSYSIADRLACTTTTTLVSNFWYCHLEYKVKKQNQKYFATSAQHSVKSKRGGPQAVGCFDGRIDKIELPIKNFESPKL